MRAKCELFEATFNTMNLECDVDLLTELQDLSLFKSLHVLAYFRIIVFVAKAL